MNIKLIKTLISAVEEKAEKVEVVIPLVDSYYWSPLPRGPSKLNSLNIISDSKCL
jgi:hypothetical protein